MFFLSYKATKKRIGDKKIQGRNLSTLTIIFTYTPKIKVDEVGSVWLLDTLAMPFENVPSEKLIRETSKGVIDFWLNGKGEKRLRLMNMFHVNLLIRKFIQKGHRQAEFEKKALER